MIITCEACGAPLDATINRPYIFCSYCGSKNFIDSEEMKMKINIPSGTIEAHADHSSLISTAEYYLSSNSPEKAREILGQSVLCGVDVLVSCITKAKIDLETDDNLSFLNSIRNLQKMEHTVESSKYHIHELMNYRARSGIQALHVACYCQDFDIVRFCVEHGADVNAQFGYKKITPIMMLTIPVNGIRPFESNANIVHQIRSYLIRHGARD